MELLTSENLIALLTLSALEIVLGIDNLVFVSILTGKLSPAERPRARRLGLAGAMIMRILLLLSLSWIMRLTQPLFATYGHEWAGRDLILFVGGMFLLGKATWEIHDKLEGAEHGPGSGKHATFRSVVTQIMLLDIVFSLDSVITAVGMARSILVMVAAVMLAVGVMLVFANAVSEFIERHPTLKLLALSFLLMIGAMLVIESFGEHVPKGYVYFAMGFSFFVELLNMRIRRKAEPVHLHHTRLDPPQ